MKSIFETVNLGNLSIKNRLVRSATLEIGAFQDGVIAPRLKSIYEELAEGGVGLIITGMMGVGYNSCAFPSMAKIYDNSFIEKFRDICDMVHEKNGKIVAQLSHCGIKARVIDVGDVPYAVSAMEIKGGLQAKEMTKEDIENLTADYASAAMRCKEAGADGVEMHAAHGYLLSQFLSPYYNKRQDEYGGSIENRARVIVEIYDRIRKEVGADYPILIKINYEDLVEGGLTGKECIEVCQMLSSRRIDAIEISSGLSVSAQSSSIQIPSSEESGYFTDGAMDVASHVDVPVISVGGYRSKEIIENVLNAGKIAAISMSRPLICEPDLPLKWQSGSQDKAKCISCTKCFGGAYGCKTFPK